MIPEIAVAERPAAAWPEARVNRVFAGRLETHVNTGLEDRQAGNPRK